MGMTLGPSVGGFLALYDYGWLFVADGVTCLAATGLLWLVPERPKEAKARAVQTSGAGSSPWRDGQFLAMMGLMFLLATVVFQVVCTFPLTLRDLYGFSEAGIGLTLAVNTLIIVVFEMVLIHKLSGRGDTLERVGLGAFLVCAGLALLPLGSSFPFAAFAVGIWTVGEMLAFPIASAVVADRAKEESLGRYMGVLNLTFASSYVAAPLIGTWVYQTWGPKALWYGCGVLGAAIWAGFHFLAVARRRALEAAGI
jgi:MFS family permease